MNTFEIFADSAANIPQELVRKHNINIISYSCTVNGEERLCYEPDVDFVQTAKRFYEDMRNGADVKTSLVDEQRIIDAVTPAMRNGRDALLVTVSSGVSGTYNQALNAKKAIPRVQTVRLRQRKRQHGRGTACFEGGRPARHGRKRRGLREVGGKKRL